jgi:predicted RNA-binding protein with PIN domain
LVLEVARLTSDWECCADVVFDGPPRGGLGHGAVVASVRAWFSERGSAADIVVAMTAEHASDGVFVVTSDSDLARRVWAFGARVVSNTSMRRALDLACGAIHAGVSPPRDLMHGPDALLALEGEVLAATRVG